MDVLRTCKDNFEKSESQLRQVRQFKNTLDWDPFGFALGYFGIACGPILEALWTTFGVWGRLGAVLG